MDTYKKIAKGIPGRITIPVALEKFCNWTDVNGYPISGYFELRADDGATMQYWLGFNDVSDRFGIFGAGGDGSLYAFWIDDENNQKIVHLGSEGEQLYILAENFIDFLRLLAVGYDEIGFANLNSTIEEWNVAIGQEKDAGINFRFREWVEKEFQVQIPDKGTNIVDVNNNTFNDWIREQMNKRQE
ncbi:hypothetical protein C8J95_11271 [Elizabethkingia sp. YR214]|uniref:SMI1/KNR4 family protein n=1 Tax=Elizabethkingia sp. YR214 TaxID=2135667 RepID=UPI000D3132B1|nr:SMI1/KNR4 family protein [Elizabethkingia sp. YR214]PUB25904.1 hypothetical protein C8J95_11271 [Elizabethkingia sp. YR214]